MAEQRFYATGKRKSSIARVWISPGTGKITINKRDAVDYLPRITNKQVILQPLELTDLAGQMDVLVSVRGGGHTGQSGAIKHGISRALLLYNPELRDQLKKAGFLTRDARIKERKKYGQRGARARFQFSKR